MAVDNYVRAIIDANVPQLGGAAGAYFTFRDKPYALQLAIEQVTSAIGRRSVVALALELLDDSI